MGRSWIFCVFEVVHIGCLEVVLVFTATFPTIKEPLMQKEFQNGKQWERGLEEAVIKKSP